MHLDRGLAHVMLDACPLDACMEIVAEFILEALRKFAAQKHGALMDEGIVMKPVVYLFPVKLLRKSVMAVAIELQPERSPCGHAQIAQTPLQKYKVEIVVQTLASNRLEKSLACLFVNGGTSQKYILVKRRNSFRHFPEVKDQIIFALGKDRKVFI